MRAGKGRIVELILEDGQRLALIACPPTLIPAAGQYLLVGDDDSDSPLPVPLFYTDSAPDSFLAAPPIPDSWNPGQELALRGPLGRGFDLPSSARKVALVAFDDSLARLRGLIKPSLRQGAAVVVVSDFESDHLPDEVEAQPLSALEEIMAWADYAAFDAARVNLIKLRERLGMLKQAGVTREAEILVRTPVPCGGVAECGVCAVNVKSGWKMGCKDGPVFNWNELGL